MNVVLLDPGDLAPDGLAQLGPRQAEHVRGVLGKGVGDTLRVGVLGGALGTGVIEADDAAGLRLRCVLQGAPPPKHPVTLVLALPRPPVLRRVLQHVTAMGVRTIVLLHTQRVEKSYWSSPALLAESLAEQLRLGLEQAVDTVPPEVRLARRFRPFVEDELPALLGDGDLLVADPTASRPCPCDRVEPTTLCIGPEGGFVPFELDLLQQRGARLVGLGRRILRVETAVVAALGRITLGAPDPAV